MLVLLGCGSAGPALKPVRGKVLVNGAPAERVAITFLNSDGSAMGNAAHPRASTDANGEFQLSSNADGDGAAEGEYQVGFAWWSDPDPDKAKDLFAGAYADPKKTNIKVKIEPGASTELKPFELKADVKQASLFVK